MSVFKDAKLTLITDDGTELNADVTPEKLAAIVRSCGFTAKEVSEKRLMLFSFDEKLRNEATELFESMGFTLPSAINAFLRRSVAEQGFPFQLKAIDRYAMQWQCTVEEDAVRKVMTITAEKNHRKSERRKKLGLAPGKAYCVADIPESYFIECWKDDELERFIGSLPFDQVKDLQAIMYLGRGDYDTFNEARGDLERFGWGDKQVEVKQIAEKSPILETYLNNGLSRMRKRDWASYSIAQEDVEQ